ncbi:MAG: hypothetical protein QOK31_142 [Solirubrobacteraceae bacterium]|nr:hypothetical protein [Solirubrobacteraceae bacterium]
MDRPSAAFSRPDQHSTRLGTVQERRPITLERTTLPVLERTANADGRRWLHVLLPGRPNGHTGWISALSTRPALTAWRLLVDISRRRVTAFLHGRVARTFATVVGSRSTPTPRGHFFVEETVQLGPGRTGAPFALALSARSDVLLQFDGGPGQIALHGLGNIGGAPGTAVSHGCLRLDRRSISWLAARLGPGVPVNITA